MCRREKDKIISLGLTNSIVGGNIIAIPSKYEIIMVLFNQSFFQYCDSSIGPFYIAPGKVITLSLFWYQFFDSFLIALSLKLLLFQLLRCDSCRSFSLLKVIAKRVLLLFAYALKRVKEQQLLLLL